MELRSMTIAMPAKSIYWQYYERTGTGNSFARCRSCSKLIKTCGNTTNLKLHVQKMHGYLMKTEKHRITGTETESETSLNSNDTFKQPAPKPSTSSASLKIIDIDSDSESDKSDISDTVIKKSVQPTLSSSFRNISQYEAETGNKGVRLSNAILYMMCKDSQPFQIVENEGFLNLLKVAAPLYKVPSRYTFKRMLENKFNVTQNYFKNKIQKVDSLTLTTDIWTDTMQCRSFLGVTVHYLDGDKMEMETATLGVFELSESHTGEYISKILLQTCNEWEINTSKVLAVVTDAGANIVKGVEIAFGRKCHIPCFAHMLNLVAQKSIEKTDKLPVLIAAVKKIVTWFKQSVIASDELRKESDLKLIQEVSTRWNSTFYMIERFLQLRPVINNIINCHASAPPMLTAIDIIELTEVCDILRPIEVATREICGEKYITSSKVIPLTRMLNIKISSMQTKHTIGESLKNSIITEIKKRLLPTEHVNILAVSTLLDPRFKNIHFQDVVACSKAIQTIKNMLITAENRNNNNEQQVDILQENTELKFDLWSEHYKIAHTKNSMSTETGTDLPSGSELNYYLKNPLLDLKQEPLETWNHIIGTTYPKLKKIALQYLSCVATSASSERLFSKAGYTLSQQRNRLKGKLLSKILFLQSINKMLWNM